MVTAHDIAWLISLKSANQLNPVARYSEDGTHAHCPNCDQEREFKRYDTKQQRQSWTCVACAHRLHPTADSDGEPGQLGERQQIQARYPSNPNPFPRRILVRRSARRGSHSRYRAPAPSTDHHPVDERC